MKTNNKNPFLLPALIAVLNLIPAGRVTAQTFTTLHSFTAAPAPYYTNSTSDGAWPFAGLITNSSGTTLYGTAYNGGSSSNGTVFAVNTDGTGFTILHSFTPTTPSCCYTDDISGEVSCYCPINSDGALPQAGLVLSGNTLYGTAYQGGSSGFGTVFAVNTDGTGFTILHSFTGITIQRKNFYSGDGQYPAAGLILSGNTLYGTTSQGGSSGRGTVFAVNTDGKGFTTLHDFTSGADNGNGSFTNSDGIFPYAGLILSGSTLYGTALYGGSSGYGTVFAVNIHGTGFTTLYSFTDGSDGAYPNAGLILSGNTLYGTAVDGGSSGVGTVFALNTDGKGFATLHSFTAGADNGNGFNTNSDGALPQAGLILSGTTLYGTASQGGSGGIGTVFVLNTDGTGFTNLHSFKAESISPPHVRSDGAYPYAGLILSGTTLYGTAFLGGGGDNGTVFAVNTDGTGFTILHSFTAFGQIYYTTSEGANPYAGLIAAGNGKTRYGTTANGGSAGLGSVFAVNTDGTGFTNLHSFTGSDGANPWAGLVSSGQTLYGTTYHGGSSGDGTLFAINTDGTGFTTLHSFIGASDGAYPNAGLILTNNILYGTASREGSSGGGSVFAVNTDGTGFTTLHDFTGTDLNGYNSDGANPWAGLISTGHTLYGTAYHGGRSGDGTVFAINTDGTGFTNLHSFSGDSEGAYPNAGLILTNNTLYGTASREGISGGGTVFAVQTDGTGFTTLHNFTGGSDGGDPVAGLILAGNTLYGTAAYGGVWGNGTVFKVNTDATGFMMLHSFQQTQLIIVCPNGSCPPGYQCVNGICVYVGGGGGGGGGVGCPTCGHCAGFCRGG